MDVKRIVGLLGISLLLIAPLGAISLDTVIGRAKEQSNRIQLLELNKSNSGITIGLSEVEETLGLSVSGDMTFRETNYGGTDTHWTVQASPQVTILLPNDNNTRITVGTTNLRKALDASGYWDADPSVGISHTFRFGDNGDNLSDLKLAQQKLSIDFQYDTSLYDFESSIYSKIMEILGYEMDLLEAEKNILVQQTQIDNALKLKTVSEGSAAYRSMQLNLVKLENAKDSVERRMAMAKTQYEQLTGFAYEPVDSIQDADLTFSYLPTGDTKVILAAMDLEIAKEELALNQRRTVSTSGVKTVPSLVVGGGAGLNYTSSPTSSVAYSVSANASYSVDNFSTDASVAIGISDTGKVTPSVTIGGSWSNDRTIASEAMELQRLQNNITIAEIDYQNALLTYQSDASQLETDILTHQLNVEAFEQEVQYRGQVLSDTQEAFDRGLVTQTDVDQAKLDVELNRYQKTIYALQALILENRAKALQL